MSASAEPHPAAAAGPPGWPSPFELGQISERVAGVGREMGEVKRDLGGKVSHAEFQRAFRVLIGLNLLILAAIVGLAFQALH